MADREFTEEWFDYSGGRKDAPELIVMVGISGSGKSTVVSQRSGLEQAQRELRP